MSRLIKAVKRLGTQPVKYSFYITLEKVFLYQERRHLDVRIRLRRGCHEVVSGWIGGSQSYQIHEDIQMEATLFYDITRHVFQAKNAQMTIEVRERERQKTRTFAKLSVDLAQWVKESGSDKLMKKKIVFKNGRNRRNTKAYIGCSVRALESESHSVQEALYAVMNT